MPEPALAYALTCQGVRPRCPAEEEVPMRGSGRGNRRRTSRTGPYPLEGDQILA